MKEYMATAQVLAAPMTRQEYNDYRGWDLPDDENGCDEGYLLESVGQPSNHEKHEGYISWSPKEVFNPAYRSNGNMDFGMAIHHLKQGKKAARSGWNGKGMFLFLVPGSTFKVNRPPLLGIYEEGHEINYLPHIDMKTATGEVVPWLASQSDVLSEDWTII